MSMIQMTRRALSRLVLGAALIGAVSMPSDALASGDGHHVSFTADAGGPIGDTLRTRALSIRKELEESAKLAEDAAGTHDEILARLKAFESELEVMKATAASQAVAEEARIVESARAEALRILEGAQVSIQDEVSRVRIALRNEAVELGVQLAETVIRGQVNANDQRRLAREFLDSIHQDGANNG